MDKSSLSMVNQNVDFTKIESINQKRTLAFINNWTLHTVAFLNQFSSVCQERLQELDNKIRRASLTLAILEAKLSSVPGLDDVVVPETSAPADPAATAAPESTAPETTPAASAVTPAAPTATPNDAAPQTTDTVESATTDIPQETVAAPPVSKDPRYAPYFKMLSVGVPAPAVKLKMNADGLDPDLLDNPNAPAPTAAEPVRTDPNDSDSDSVSSWSD